MWPWGHLAVGYLCWVGVAELRDYDESGATLAAVALGSQVPDLVDKPLAWSLGVLPSGRSLAHSLLVAGVVLGVAYLAVARDRRRAVAALGVGWVAHSLADLGPRFVGGLLAGNTSQLEWAAYLLWPVLDAPPYPHDSSFLRHLQQFTLDPYVGFQFALLGVAVAVWRVRGPRVVGASRETGAVSPGEDGNR